jgi:hypothetical protein
MNSPNDKFWLAGGERPHTAITKPGFDFVTAHSQLLDLDLFFQKSGLDRMRMLANLIGESHEEARAEVRKFFDEFREHRNLMSELALCRVVDTFLQYLSNLLALIYKTRPEMLKSSEKETIDFVLSHSSMDDLRAALAEKKIEKLSYLGFKDLAKHLEEYMGFPLFPDPAILDAVAELVEYRNIFVHAAGVVGTTSARRVPNLASKVGKRLEYVYADFRPHRQTIENAVFDIDERAIQKFGLPAKVLPSPPPELP